ncbi:MAG TPA: DUF3551 domain-containing protein [Steroidobacteraceae bacterium]
MNLDRQKAISAAVLLACSAIAGVPSSAAPAAAARSGVPPFCVLRGGARGFPLPQICRFFDFQQCLQAAADLHGNCVVNMDYHGEVLMPPGAAWSRDRR